MKKLCLPLILAVLCLPAPGQTRSSEVNGSAVRKTLAAFIQAFDNLDWNRFRSAFADDATVFYPRSFPSRANGRAEFERTFQLVFDQIRAGRKQGPYMDLQPRDLRIQIAEDVAVVTFHLDDKPGFINRRTVVLRKVRTDWKIIHLHASEVQSAVPQPAP